MSKFLRYVAVPIGGTVLIGFSIVIGLKQQRDKEGEREASETVAENPSDGRDLGRASAIPANGGSSTSPSVSNQPPGPAPSDQVEKPPEDKERKQRLVDQAHSILLRRQRVDDLNASESSRKWITDLLELYDREDKAWRWLYHPEQPPPERQVDEFLNHENVIVRNEAHRISDTLGRYRRPRRP